MDTSELLKAAAECEFFAYFEAHSEHVVLYADLARYDAGNGESWFPNTGWEGAQS